METRLKNRINRETCFDAFEGIARYALEESELVLDVLEAYESSSVVGERLEAAHAIEHASDEAVLALLKATDSDLVPPIEREDIVSLAIALDEVTDRLEAILKNLFMYHVDELREPAVKMCRIIHEECAVLHEATLQFRNFRKPAQLIECARRIDELEDEIDGLYLYGVRALFSEGADATTLIKWIAVLSALEEASDFVEHVADLMAQIVVKND